MQYGCDIGRSFTAIPPGAILPGSMPDFRIFIRSNNRYILWAREGNTVTVEQLKKLADGPNEVYIDVEDGFKYDQYLETYLGDILKKEEPSNQQKAEIFSRVTNKVIGQTFAKTQSIGTLPQGVADRVKTVVENAFFFIAETKSLEALSKIIGHDYKTYEHATKVMWLTVLFLKENSDILEQIEPDYVHFTEHEKKKLLEQCGVAAILHDIGKVFVPTEILNKNGPLNEVEWEIVKRHPFGSLALLLDTGIPTFVKKAVLHHHEDFKGGGYPIGVAGDDIHPLARVIKIADVFDAMTSKRPYKDAMVPAEAIKIMVGTRSADNGNGRQNRDSGMKHCFDEKYLRKFVVLLGKLPATAQRKQTR